LEERYARRISKLKEVAMAHDVDCLVLMPGTNLFYLTGISMHTSERASLLFIPTDDGDPAWFAPKLEFDKLTELSGIPNGMSWTDEAGPGTSLAELVAGLGYTGRESVVIGCENRSMRLLEWELLTGVLPCAKRKNADPLVASLRIKKDASEIQLMQKAAEIAEGALNAARQVLQPGITEREFAGIIRQELGNRGSDTAFGPSVAFGPNTGFPHSQLSDRVLADGELVWVDMGALYEGYCSDITRTFAVGEIDAELREIYDTVYEAQKEAREKAGPGMTATQVDALCRDIIAEAGYGEYFTHRTGHGLGIDVHEEPYMVAGSDLVLEPGMVFTIEPGIYLPGKGGVRIEDDVVVTEQGVRSLTTYKRYWL